MDFYSGQYDVDDQALSRTNAQMQFLGAVREYAPDVLEALRAGPLGDFYGAEIDKGHWRLVPLVWLELLALTKGQTLQEMAVEHGEFLISRGYSVDYDSHSARTLTEQLQPLANSLLEWSKTYGLDADWCRARAFFTLAQWVYRETSGYFNDHSKANAPHNEWSYDRPNVSIPFDFEEFEFKWAWHPARTSRATITRVMRSIFEQQLQKYLDKVETRFKEQTGLKTALKVKRAKKHFHWLVLFQVRGYSYQEIFDTVFPRRASETQKEYLSDDTKLIRKAINELAQFIDLPLRVGNIRRGRKPKKKQ